MDPAIRLKNVSKSFAGKPVLRDVSLDVPPGSIFALLGENGAGKSTTMRILAGLIPVDRGEAQILGKEAFRHAIELRHKVGYVPEKPKYYDWMTIHELGWFAAGFHAADYLDRFRKQIDIFKLDGGQKLKTLSKGQYAKVGLALALALDPQVLLLDEPTSGLDLFVRREFLSSMVGLAAEGRTILISSHQVAEVERIASHVAFLSDGHYIFAGSVDDLRRRVVSVTFDADRAPADPAKLGTILRQAKDGRSQSVVLLDPKEGELGDHSANSLTLEEAYEALLAEKEPQK